MDICVPYLLSGFLSCPDPSCSVAALGSLSSLEPGTASVNYCQLPCGVLQTAESVAARDGAAQFSISIHHT